MTISKDPIVALKQMLKDSRIPKEYRPILREIIGNVTKRDIERASVNTNWENVKKIIDRYAVVTPMQYWELYKDYHRAPYKCALRNNQKCVNNGCVSEAYFRKQGCKYIKDYKKIERSTEK